MEEKKKTPKIGDPVARELVKTQLDLALTNARINYLMTNPRNFGNIGLYYDSTGEYQSWFPPEIRTKRNIIVTIRDNNGLFSAMPGEELLELFEKELNYIRRFIQHTDMFPSTPILALLLDIDLKPLGLFAQGKYLLWKDKEWGMPLTLH